jgi:HD superfamily phosphohydrolase YqeK
MSDADSTEPLDRLPPILRAAARGELPMWSRATPPRLAHMGRVAGLLEAWARDLGLADDEALRWAAAGWLHDMLRDADPADLLEIVSESERDLPGPVLHGPAAAASLAGEVPTRILNAIRHHTIGHPSLDDLGRALYLADFLEPGRTFRQEWTASLRARMPHDRDAVLVEVVASRIQHLIDKRKPIRPETAAFWSSLVKGPRG